MNLIHEIQKRQEATRILLDQLYQYQREHHNKILIPRHSVVDTTRELEKLQIRLRHSLEVEENPWPRKD